MKPTSNKMRRQFGAFLISAVFAILLFTSCNKWEVFKDHFPDKPGSPSSYSSDVIEKWMALQVRLMKNATGIPNHGFSRHYAYSGIAAWESITPGVPQATQWQKKWNGLTGLPQANPSQKYYWPANINAALAAINKSMFPNASDADKAAIDSLENALTQHFLTVKDYSVVSYSADFGKAVASAVYNWAEADGYKNASAPYTPPTGPGLWAPIPPAVAVTPYWGNNRPIVKGSIDNTHPGAPISYSTDPNSDFYKAVKKLHDVSQTLTPDQTAMAIYWKDVPGATSPGHWLSILQQTVHKENASLAKAAFAYAFTGASGNDGLIACFKTKYQYNVVRPISYIRDVMGHTAWNTVVPTPAHPEYPSSHSALSGGTAYAFEKIFGSVQSFTDHTYDYLGYTARTYTSYSAIAKEAGQSRLYGGIHYQFSIDAGLLQGKKVADNIFDQYNFSGF